MQYSKSPPGAAKPGYGAASMSEAFMAKDGARVDGDAMEGVGSWVKKQDTHAAALLNNHDARSVHARHRSTQTIETQPAVPERSTDTSGHAVTRLTVGGQI
jgi:hypothetical protein